MSLIHIATPTGYLFINCAWNWGKGLESATPVLGSFVSRGIYLLPPLILRWSHFKFSWGSGKRAYCGSLPFPPFENFQVSPIRLVPKKHSDKFQTIFHLSFPKSGTTSINHFIDKDDFSLQYITIDKAISAIQRFGSDCFMTKTDIESAFRPFFLVHPHDWEFLGMFWSGSYHFDKVLPFGLRSAPFIFNQLSDAIEWILQNNCAISFVCHILDDFLIIEPPAPTAPFNSLCQVSLSSMILSFKNLNIPTSAAKTEGPCKVIQFMIHI